MVLKQAEQPLVKATEGLETRLLEQQFEIDETLKKLENTRDTFYTLFYANPIPTALTRPEDGLFINVNQAFLNFFKIRREDLLGHAALKLDSVVDPEERTGFFARVQRERSISNFEMNVRIPTGEFKTVLISSHIINVDDCEMLLTAVVDVTEQRQAEETLRSMVDAAPDATVVIDEDGTIVLVNKQLEIVFGHAREELIGKTIRTLIPERFHEIHPQRRRQYFHEPKVRPMGSGLKLFGRRSDGTEFPVEISLSPLKTPDGMRAIAAIRDITERVEADRKIRELATHLTKAEQNERHRISQVLHDDLQQRLFATQMQLTTLHDLYKQGDWEALQIALADMSDWLAESIRITRNLSVNISPILLHGDGLIHAVEWLAAQMHKQYAFKVIVQAENIDHRFEDGLRIMLFQVIRELLFNVVKHSGVQEAVVGFECHEDLIRITISDKGRGFDAVSALRDYKLGHGLISARQRLELLGCDLQVFSTPGAGTRVVIDCIIAQAVG